MEVPTPRSLTDGQLQQTPQQTCEVPTTPRAWPRDAAKSEVDGQLLSKPLFDEEMDNMCEGCMTRNTGDNFAHAGLCKSCMTAMMDMDHKLSLIHI